MNPRTNFYHAVEILLSKVNEIKKQKKFDFSGTKAAAHHACHYYKVKYLDVLGHPENPQLIDTIAAACGTEPVRWYEDRTLTCGMGFSTILSEEFIVTF
jgi:heterodisulfide reductase subunit B